jgi:protein involved in polysaccharide export with SLBB domain
MPSISRRTILIASVLMCLLFAAVPRLVSGEGPKHPVDMIVADDLLCVGIWDIRPTGGETLKTVRVDPDGNISLYYVGTVRVAGKNFEEAEKEINDAYRASGVLQTPAPSVNRLEAAAAASISSAKIAAGERISVRILDLVPDIEESRIFTVSEGGKVGLPLLGQFKVAGMTEAEAEKAITKAFEEQFNLEKIPVSVLRLAPHQEAEPTTAGQANSRPTQQLPRTRR